MARTGEKDVVANETKRSRLYVVGCRTMTSGDSLVGSNKRVPRDGGWRLEADRTWKWQERWSVEVGLELVVLLYCSRSDARDADGITVHQHVSGDGNVCLPYLSGCIHSEDNDGRYQMQARGQALRVDSNHGNATL